MSAQAVGGAVGMKPLKWLSSNEKYLEYIKD